MSKIKDRDEIEQYFSEIKNKNFPTWIVFILISILIIGGFCYYYFIIDSPKNIFLNIINSNQSNIKINISKEKTIYYKFNLDTNMISNNKQYIDTINIIKEIALSGTGKIDLPSKEQHLKLNTFYKGNKLINIDAYSNKDNIYLKSEDIFDKTIKINNSKKNQTNNEHNIEIDNVKKLINSIKEETNNILNKLLYKKEYTELNNIIVKKVSLYINKQTYEDLYNNLLDNDNFIESYSKLLDKTKSEIKESIKEKINNLNNNNEIISLYLSVFDNKFIMLENINNEEKVILTKENNKYNYKMYDNSIIKYQGYIEIVKLNNNYKFSLSIEDIEEELNVTINLDLSFEKNENIESIDKNNYINYEDLTKEDSEKILNNLQKNETLQSLYEEIISIYSNDSYNKKEPQLTTT